jgi:Helicase HerA, central domain
MKITIGKTAEGKNVGFDLDELITTRLLIQANSGAGKSYLLRKLMEQLFGHIQVIAIDPEGEFATLREKYGFVLVGKGGETPADPRIAADVAEKLLEIRASAVCDIYELKPAERHHWVRLFLDALVNAPKKLWHPLIVVIDEAHVFCPEKGAGESEAKDSMLDLSTRGRKRGFCPLWATQRLSKLDKDGSSNLLNRLVGGTFEDVDIRRALDLLSIVPEEKRAVAQQLKTLDPGCFYAFGRAIARERLLFKVGEVETSHPKPGSAKHASEPPPAPEEVKDLLPKLADLPKAAEEKARTIQELQHQLRLTRAELAAAKRERPAPTSPTIDKQGVARLVKEISDQLLAARDEQWMHAVEKHGQRARKAIEQACLQLESGFDMPPAMRVEARINVEKVLPANRGKEVVAVSQQSVTGEAAPPVAASPNAGERLSRSYAQRVDSEMTDLANGKLSRPQLKILEALAEFEAIGCSPVPRKWLAVLAKASHRSSAYTNNLGHLRSHGYITYPGDGVAALTGLGRVQVAALDPPRTSEEMLERCKQIVSRPQAAILQVLHDVYPKAMDKGALAEAAGASPTSSAFTNNLGALRAAGMIDYPEDRKARIADWILLE